MTSAELAETMAAAVAAVDPQLGAVLELYDDVLEDKRHEASDAAATGTFAGVPFLRKDLHPEKGRLCENGSRLTAGVRADFTGLTLERFAEAGLVFLGRSAVPEFGAAPTTESALSGATRNPWDTGRIPGGSSGGAAAAVASGILPMADASDGAGSIRQPAAVCGLVGLKPSRGRVSFAPVADEAGFGLATELVVSRTVRDTAAALDVVGRPAPGDPFVIAQPQRPFLAQMAEPLPRLRVAAMDGPWPAGAPDAPNAAAVAHAATLLADAGHEVTTATLDFDHEAFSAFIAKVGAADAHAHLTRISESLGRALDADHLEYFTLAQLEIARRVTTRELMAAFAGRDRVQRPLGALFADYDVLITPTLATPVPAIDALPPWPEQGGALDWWYAYDPLAHCWALFNVCGQPAISVPFPHAPDGLPLGVQFVGRFAHEATLLQLAAFFEQVQPWAERLPAVHVSRSKLDA